MRNLTYDELYSLDEQIDLLQGCIDRMCVTHDINEFYNMAESSTNRLIKINSIMVNRLKESEKLSLLKVYLESEA